jgi:hypothetical protein
MQIGLSTLLFILLLALKLTHQIAWSWLWVTAPLWGGFVVFGAFAMFCLFMAVATGQAFRK